MTIRISMSTLLGVGALLAAGTAQASVLPAVVSGTVALHLDAGQGVTVNGSNVVTNWGDLSGFNADFGYAEGDPTLVANVLNGKPGVRFTPSASDRDRLLNFNGNLFGALSNQPLTVFAVTVNANQLGGLLDSNSGFPGTWRFIGNTVQHPGEVLTPVVPVLQTGSLTTVRQDATGEYQTFLNSVFFDSQDPTDTAGGFFGATTTIGGYGTNGDLSSNFSGDLLELVIYKGALSGAERLAVENALLASYAIPEPSSAVLMGLGVMAIVRRKR